ncbi:MAG: hypothetical protein APF76_11335 [Desulfitibacter sp. BRH_c19]|nr:MAG: hypothetical protein APF76_11335 [Desulfitibacter sp. BRH_c19]
MKLNQDKYRLLLERLPNPFAYHRIILDKKDQPIDYVILDVNLAFQEMMGLKKVNIIGKRVTNVLPGIKYSNFDWITTYGKEAVTGKSISFQQYSECLDKWYTATSFSDEPGYFAVVFHDVTERTLAEDKLTQYQDIVENMQVGLHVYHLENLEDDRSLRMILTNPSASLHTGLKKENVLGKTIDEVYPKLRAMGVAKKYADVVRTGNSIELDNLYYSDHKNVQVHFSIKAFPLPKNCVGVSFENVTDRKQAEEALQESERSKSVLLSNIPGMSYRCHYDCNWTMEFVSQGCHELTGYKQEELLYNRSISFNDIILPEYHEQVRKAWEKGVSSCEPVGVEYRIRSANLEEKWVWEQGVPVYNEEGEIEALEGLIIDITDRKQAERALFEQAQRQELAAQLATSFLNKSLNHIHKDIEDVLMVIGNVMYANRCYLLEFSANNKIMSNTYEWCSEGVKPKTDATQNQPMEPLPWLYEQIMNKKTVHINKADDLPFEANVERQEFQRHSIQSLICVPTIVEDRVTGFIGVDAVCSESRWNENDVLILQIVGGIISSAIKRGRLESELTQLTFYDQVTGLYNRNFFEEEIRRLDTDRQLPFSIIVADLNGLKLVNDTYGHSVGDEMLVKSAEVLKKSCREEDIVARWGGDEFVILLPQTSANQVGAICKRIIKKCNETYVEDIPCSMALGVATKNSGEKDIPELLKEAEYIMYKNKLTESKSAKSVLFKAILKTLEEKSHETESHVRQMQFIGMKIGEKLGLPESEMSRLYLLISMHDIGKINIPEDILRKKGNLTQEEWEIIKKHPEIGCRITRSTEEFAHVAGDILCHHEKWDGSGYPRGIKKTEIPLLARIIAIADAYEVMCNGRPYKAPLSQKEIIDEFKNCAGSQFDPDLVKLLIEILEWGQA